MPPDRGRASKACTACRKQKTRCYESAGGGACLRCERLRQPCSLELHASPNNEGSVWPQLDNRASNDRLDRLERTVGTLIHRLDELAAPIHPSARRSPSPSQPSQSSQPSIHPDLEIDTVEPGPAPLFVLRDVATESGVQAPDRTTTNTPMRGVSQDVITKGLLTVEDATSLIALFHEHYGRWVSFSPITTPGDLLVEVRRSPLLLCACCLISVRHTTQELASTLGPKLFREAKSLLSAGLLTVPQPIEFFQAALILCMWSTSIGQIPLSIDSWLLSGFALQHSLASDLFKPSSGTGHSAAHRKRELDRWCVWNHLCLVHLHYCVGTRRKAMLDNSQLERCRSVLGSDHATNFEARMVGEVYLYWIIYESCSASPVDLPKTQAALHLWKDEWKFLFDQPRSQFIQMGFHFAQLLVYDQSLKSRSAAVRESLLSEMVRLSTAIINLAMETADDRTRHLTDHIYHMISFAAVTICRLLNVYEDQLVASYNIGDLDTLIISLVSWLHAIGLPCHIAYTMGDVVAAFHKKLRPDYGPSPSASYIGVDPSIQDDFAQYFPELFGPSSFDIGNGTLLPNWGSII